MNLGSAVLCIVTILPVITSYYARDGCPKECICPTNFTDCKYNRLTEVPKGLDQNVTVLDLSCNEFQQFPEELNNYPSLTYLNFSNNKIQTITVGAFKELKNLEWLDLTHNLFKDWMDIRAQAFLLTKKLNFLDLSHNPLRSLPGEKSPLQSNSLEILRLNNCSIVYINNKILEKLPKLKELHLSGNPIRTIRSNLASNSLKFLDLSHCDLQHFGASVFTNLTALETIYMHNNKNLKKFYCESTSLNYLVMSDCNLESVPSGNFPNLETANFHGNHFRTIPTHSFVNYTKLRNLDLSYNAISIIEMNAFTGLENIVNIDLSQNTLSSVTIDLFESNKNLKFLNMSRNYFSKVPNLISDSLKKLDLTSCEIQSVDRDCLLDMINLEILDLSKNIISVLPDLWQADNLNTLNVNLCRIKNVNNKTFALMTSLRHLNLAGNRLTKASSECFPQVTFLDISDNPWRCDCPSLKDLYMWLSKTGKRIDNLYCQSPEIYEGMSWFSACQKKWQPDITKSETVWWYTTGLIVTVFIILFVILAMRRMYLLKEKRIRQANETRRIEERETLRRMQRMQAETREDVNRNAPDPRELQRPPSYNEALLLPRLDSSHPSLSGSLHSIASKHSINGSLQDVSKRGRPRRKRRRRKSDSSEGQRASRVVVDDSDTTDHEPQPRTTLESDF